MKAGDTISSTFQYYQFEMVVDSIAAHLPQYAPCFSPPEVYMDTPKVFYLSHVNCPGCAQIIWVEGIGNIANPFYSFISWSAGNLGDALLCHFDESGFPDYHYVYCEEPAPCQGPLLDNDEIEEAIQIKLYPNPFDDIVHLEMPDNRNFIKSIEYYNSEGLLIRTENEFFGQKISLSAFNPGLIYVVIRTKNGKVITKKLIKR